MRKEEKGLQKTSIFSGTSLFFLDKLSRLPSEKRITFCATVKGEFFFQREIGGWFSWCQKWGIISKLKCHLHFFFSRVAQFSVFSFCFDYTWLFQEIVNLCELLFSQKNACHGPCSQGLEMIKLQVVQSRGCGLVFLNIWIITDQTVNYQHGLLPTIK